MRTYTDTFITSLLTGAVNFDADSFSLVFLASPPGTASSISNVASLGATLHTEAVTLSRLGGTVSLTADSFTVPDVAVTTNVALVDTTADVVCWWDDGYTLDPNGGTVTLSAQANLLTLS